MLTPTHVLTSLLLITSILASTRVELPLPERKSVVDQSSLVKLAQEEKFVIPLNGRAISHSIQYVPKNSGECQFHQPTITYKSLAQTQAIFNNEDEITSVLPLKTREIVIVADPYFNIASFSIDRHFLLKPKLPKTNLQKPPKHPTSPSPSTSTPTKLVSPILLSTSNEQYIYYLTQQSSYVFHYSNIASDIKEFKLEGDPAVIYKAIYRNGFVVVCAGVSGILVYRVDQATRYLKLVQKIEPKDVSDTPVDMELNQQTQLLYVLNSAKTIQIYLLQSKSQPPATSTSTPSTSSTTPITQILTPHDTLPLQNLTLQHPAYTNPYQTIGHKNIEISRNRPDQTIMILFEHGVKAVVAELNYHSVRKEFCFVRYFKYSTLIKEIHVIEDVMVVVGAGLLGMFPYGINPYLIVQEYNGFMTLTPIQKISITQAPFFIGISKTQLQFGGIFLSNQAGINCHLSSTSQLKQLKFKVNLTSCSDLSQAQVTKYCEYEKTFIIKQMQLTASAPVAASLWIATICFTVLVVIGLCCLFAIQKRKEREIRKLELYFEEKRRAVPAQSDRT